LIPTLALLLSACDDGEGSTSLTTDDAAVTADQNAGGGGVQDSGAAGAPVDSALEQDQILLDQGGDVVLISDMNVSQDTEPQPDLQADISVIDAALDVAPDLLALDSAFPPQLDTGLACEPGGDQCGASHSCMGGICRVDPRPNYFRLVQVGTDEEPGVLAPVTAAAILEGMLNSTVAMGELNLLFEPGGYDESDRYLFSVGNGIEETGTYAFNHNLPIQGYPGFWYQDNQWFSEGPVEFMLNVPSSRVNVELEDGTTESRICWVRFPATVEISIQVHENDGALTLEITLNGYLRQSDVEQVAFNLNGSEIRLADFLINEPLSHDADEDGELDSYSFAIEKIRAEPILFSDPNEERNPSPEDLSPPECFGGG